MKDDIIIRKEREDDYRKVENLTREAFWNLYTPGCDEHYLVNIVRKHKDFIPELDFVAEYKGEIIGNIMYTKSFILTEDNQKIPTISFGPLCVLPKYQRKGIGTALIEKTKEIAKSMGYKAIIILGSPYNYCKHGFKTTRDFNITDSNGQYPLGQLVLELETGYLQGVKGKFLTSDVYELDPKEVEAFDLTFPRKEKKNEYSQDVFNILVRSYVK